MKTDIFLFHTYKNDHVKELDYQLLENIKDGWTMSTDYGDDIHFKRSNVIIVFSNMYPDIQQLSEDKWMILKINNMMELKHVTHYINMITFPNDYLFVFAPLPPKAPQNTKHIDE